MSDASGRGDRVRLFTLAEANAMLAIVRPLLDGLAEVKRGLDVVHNQLLRISPKMRENGHRLEALRLEDQMERLVDRLSRGIRDLELMGIEIKDVDTGLIDFPSLHHGRVIYLCWRLGESEIAYWHEITTGFAGRRSVAELDDA
ncbi:MAG: DUF2203 domain-containing protein [Thermomicrobiales bacterium]|nr:DUF2203 domain-containing protein [Thermomicrobiales bacterium]